MFHSTDQLHRAVTIKNFPPKRIVSLVPSQTELLYSLGLEEEVVGITKFCVHPQNWFASKDRVGGTKQVDIEKVFLLGPDLIIANKEENVKEQIGALEKIAPVWVSDVNNFDDALAMIESIGGITGKTGEVKMLCEEILYRFQKLQTVHYKLQTLYLIWRQPYMAAGGGTFINDMLCRCGLQNIFEYEKRYPEISGGQLWGLNCQLVLLSSEPYPFKEQHIEEVRALLPHAKILMVDGEMFSWYGSRMLQAAQYFKELQSRIFEPSGNRDDIA